MPLCTNRRQSAGLTLNVTMNTHTYTWTQAGASRPPDARFEFCRFDSPCMRSRPPVFSSLMDWHKPTYPEHGSEALITCPQWQLCEKHLEACLTNGRLGACLTNVRLLRPARSGIAGGRPRDGAH